MWFVDTLAWVNLIAHIGVDILLSVVRVAGNSRYNINLFSKNVNMRKGCDINRHWGVGHNLDLLHMLESPFLETKQTTNK